MKPVADTKSDAGKRAWIQQSNFNCILVTERALAAQPGCRRSRPLMPIQHTELHLGKDVRIVKKVEQCKPVISRPSVDFSRKTLEKMGTV